MSSKFKKGDKVVLLYLDSSDSDRGLEAGMKGVVDQDDNNVPWVIWENDLRVCVVDDQLSLENPSIDDIVRGLRKEIDLLRTRISFLEEDSK